MSKERELLKRCLDEFDFKGVSCPKLYIDINKLLAKPEQQREPLSDDVIAELWGKYVEENKSWQGHIECAIIKIGREGHINLK